MVLALDSGFIPAHLNLADLYREQGIESKAEAQLLAGLALAPDNADLHHALGLSRVRTKRLDAALEDLKRATELAPANPRFAYVYAVALDGAGRTWEALPILEAAAGRDAGNTELLVALVQYHAKLGQREAAITWLDKLAVVAPDDPAVGQLRGSLKPTQP